jgi:hypothetical protein
VDRAGPVDAACLEARGPAALGVADGAGIAVNLLFLALAPSLAPGTPHRGGLSRHGRGCSS